MTALSRPTVAVLTLLLAAFITSVQDTTIKSLSGAYPFHEMQVIRSLSAMMVVTGYVVWQTGGLAAIADRDWAYICLRSLVLSLASICFYLTAAAMPFSEAVALYFTMPLIVALLAGPLVGERVGWHRIIAVMIGFLGVVVIVKPGSAVFEPVALLGLFASIGYGVGNLMVRAFSTPVATSVIAFYMNLFFLLTGGALAALFGTGWLETGGHPSLAYLTSPWVMPSAWDLGLFVLVGAATGVLMILYTIPYRMADASYIAPFEYSTLLWAMLFAFLILGEVPSLDAVVGIALIAGAGLFMLAMDRYISRNRRQAGQERWHRPRGYSGPRTAMSVPLPAPQHQPTGPRRGPPGRIVRHADRRS